MKKNTENQIEIPINVNGRIIRHISRGIYRTSAGALKELISNAYDAGAKKVTVNTGYPIFEKMIVIDNGSGMSYKKFELLIQNIGFSDKIAGTEFKVPGTNTKRRTVGHYGIGLLAIGQICNKVTITSKEKNSLDGFEAILEFEQFEVKKIKGINRSSSIEEEVFEKKDPKMTDFRSLSEEDKKFEIGKCLIKKIYYTQENFKDHFTKLSLENIRELVQKKLSGGINAKELGLDQQDKYIANFSDLLKLYREKENDIRQGHYPYEKLCWELGNYCPVKFPQIDIFQKNSDLEYFGKLAEKYRFELIIDGFQLTKTYESTFFDDPNFKILDVFSWHNEEFMKGKRVSGFLIRRRSIRPKSMQGVLIRESGIAIGMNSTTYLEYPFHEGTKFEQLTGEIFVEGLSSALNIDRNSFNETDETYLALSSWFHYKLNKIVFPKFQKDLHSVRIFSARMEYEKLMKKYFKHSNSNYKLKLEKMGKNNQLFKKDNSHFYLNLDHSEGKIKKGNIEKLLLMSILIVEEFLSEKKLNLILTIMNKIKKK